MERGLMLLSYAVILGLLLYGIMFYGLGQSPKIAEDRSILIASLVLIYIILFGYKLPMERNKNIF